MIRAEVSLFLGVPSFGVAAAVAVRFIGQIHSSAVLHTFSCDNHPNMAAEVNAAAAAIDFDGFVDSVLRDSEDEQDDDRPDLLALDKLRFFKTPTRSPAAPRISLVGAMLPQELESLHSVLLRDFSTSASISETSQTLVLEKGLSPPS